MIEKPDVVDSKLAYDGWLKVRQDTLKIPGLKSEYNYDVVLIPSGVAILPFIDKETLLLQYQYRHPISEKILELVQGGVDKGETSINAAKRELFEETGYSCNLYYLNTIYLMPGSLDNRLDIFYADSLEKTSDAENNPLETCELVKMPYEQVLQEVLSGKHKDSALVSAILFYGAIQRKK
ncbi:RNA pyrophosphohydrolase [uncultured archaeon]|nr:RNA pyrophosphohydrolase [uncultured archaeon]